MEFRPAFVLLSSLANSMSSTSIPESLMLEISVRFNNHSGAASLLQDLLNYPLPHDLTTLLDYFNFENLFLYGFKVKWNARNIKKFNLTMPWFTNNLLVDFCVDEQDSRILIDLKSGNIVSYFHNETYEDAKFIASSFEQFLSIIMSTGGYASKADQKLYIDILEYVGSDKDIDFWKRFCKVN
jgi:hypothetical protein